MHPFAQAAFGGGQAGERLNLWFHSLSPFEVVPSCWAALCIQNPTPPHSCERNNTCSSFFPLVIILLCLQKEAALPVGGQADHLQAPGAYLDGSGCSLLRGAPNASGLLNKSSPCHFSSLCVLLCAGYDTVRYILTSGFNCFSIYGECKEKGVAGPACPLRVRGRDSGPPQPGPGLVHHCN